MAEDAVLRISAEIDEYKRILAKIPDVTEKEARRASSRMAQQLAKGQVLAGKKATAAAKSAGAAWKNAGEAGKQAAEAIGGQAGAAAGVVEKLARSFGELSQTVGPVPALMGGVAVGVLGITLAAAGLVKGLFAVVGAADAAVERLKEIEGTKPLPASAIQSLEDWNQAALGAEAAGERLKVVVGAELADAFADSLPALQVTAEILGKLAGGIGFVKRQTDKLIPVARTLAGAFSLGTTEALIYAAGLDDVASSARETSAGLVDTAKEAEDLGVALMPSLEMFEKIKSARAAEEAKNLAEANRAAAKAAREHAAALREQAKAAAEAAREEAATAKQLDDFLVGVRKGKEAGAKAEAARHDARIAEISEEAAALQVMFDDTLKGIADQGAAEEAAAAARSAGISNATTDATAVVTAAIGLASELAQQQMQTQMEVAASARNEIAGLRDLRKEAHAEQIRLNDALLTDDERVAQAEREAAKQLARDKSGATQAEIDATKAELDAKLDAEKKKRRAARKAGMQAFRASRQLARTEIGVSTAAAVIKAFAVLGPVAGTPAAAAAGLTGATQLAKVNAQKPPQFHQGNVAFPSFSNGPDEIPVIQRQGESTLNQRATEALGRDRVDELNRTGAAPSSGTTFVNVLDGRTLSRVQEREATKRGTSVGSLGMRGGPVGVQDVYGAG